MFYKYRELTDNEFIVVGGDCSQGGDDYNVCQFLSKTHLDVPIVYRSQGVAATMTGQIVPALNYVFDKTHVEPVVALERNNGGASEMERLSELNRQQKYRTYIMRDIGKRDPGETNRLGFDTNTATRPMMLGDLKKAVDQKLFTIYDENTINEMFSFIINNGKPEAEVGAHDDTIFALAIAWQLYQTEEPTVKRSPLEFSDESEMFQGGYY